MTTFGVFNRCGALAMCFFVFFVVSLAQNTSPAPNGPPTAVAEKLQQRGISLTKEGLVLALRSKEPETRFLAAVQLASEGAKETIPDIRDALGREDSPLAKINIGYALAQLKDKGGFQALEEACSDSRVASHLRLFAARYLQDLHSNYCISSVLDILQNSDNPSDRMEALSLLPRFHELPENDAARIEALVVRALQDATPAVRISAGQAISVIGAKTDDQYIEAAINREGEGVVRSQLQLDLQRLRKRYNENEK
jgi:HEAT repeat protein